MPRFSVSGFDTDVSIFRMSMHGGTSAEKRRSFVDHELGLNEPPLRNTPPAACDPHSAGVVIFSEFCSNKCTSHVGT